MKEFILKTNEIQSNLCQHNTNCSLVVSCQKNKTGYCNFQLCQQVVLISGLISSYLPYLSVLHQKFSQFAFSHV